MLSRLTIHKPAEAAEFSDISQNWAKDHIEALFAEGVINGRGNGTFKPNDYASRAESVTMLLRLLDKLV
ncbi:S-layer homology domain-containing protein [Paenibacillus algorifonticola]|uniref:S-layer homology domain-containing protein n=1 Tax=Paenibacillus algorifonticola TaxID=684063 RepID=A0A1I2FPM8_9BACL|nr:S-layer homology domain-containing protein [Paenibacillus algorifonticola]SFF07444.1 S-layer homology domain-containing protein [Paenibacillus algorifonticola]